MTGRSADRRTQAREAYFRDLSKDLVKTSPLPLMLTGGSRGAPPPNEYGTAASLSSAWAPPSLSLRTCPKARV
ncbi:hypothetical protein [Streptomyces anulatus]|uniref:hypothetical protein n=1 Tax=Streptomyces anulatus TaxID=1892 RepID=UPI0033F8A7C7